MAAGDSASGERQRNKVRARREGEGRKGFGGKGSGRAAGRGRGTGRGGGGRGHAASAGRGSAPVQQQRQRRPLADLLDYLRSCSKTLEEGLSNKEDEALLSSRAIEEMADRILLIAADQRGSKPLERLLRRATPESFQLVFKPLVEALPDLAPNQYGSHVLESVFASWAERLGREEPSKPPAEPLVALCGSLREDRAWSALVVDPCSSHVVRALLLALGGYAPDPQGKGKVAARAGLLPEKRFDVPPAVAESRRSTAAALVTLLRQDDTLCLNANASPVVQLLLRILRDRGDRSLLAEACAAVVGAPVANGKPSIPRCESLLHSAPGSRALEAAVETASAELLGELFSRYFRPRLRGLATGEASEFGPFMAQRLADGLREEPQLQLALSELDFVACLGGEAGPSQHVVVLKFLEAALRLRGGLKQAAGGVFRALGLHVSSEYHRAWPTILALERLEDVEALQRASADSKLSQKRKGAEAQGQEQDGTGTSSSSSAPPWTLRNLPSAGPQILAMLLRFPAETVVPVTTGLTKVLAKPQLLQALAKEARTARVLEAALAPSSALAPNLRLKMARAFKGCLAALGPHHIGGWVCAAVWRASLGDSALREALAKELLSVEEELRKNNFAVWKVCGLHQVKVRQDEWSQQQKKAGKTQRLFGELLEGGDAEAAKAAAAARARAAEDKAMAKAAAEAAVLADPTIAGLLPAAAADSGDDAEAADMTEGGDKEIDELLSARPKKRRSKKDNAIEQAAPEAGKPSAKAAGGDSSLLEALELIKGRASSRVKRKQKKRSAKLAADTAEPAEEAEASVSTPKKKLKKGKRPGFTY